MGNIISDNIGNIRTYNNTETDENNPSAFTKNMTDILFELDLYNTGNYYDQKTTQNPRSEFDYNDQGKEKSTRNIDIDSSGRRAINDNFVDIINLPYEDNSLTIDSMKISNEYKSILIDKEDRKINRFYNLKRGFCMGANSVPIDIVGVDIPSKDPEGYWNNIGKRSTNLFNDQKNIYGYTDTMNVDIEKCITWGTLNSPTVEFNTYTGTDFSNTIPDIDITKDNLNTLANDKNIYGNILSPDCKTLLDKTMMNSYVSPKINQYRSLNLAVTDNGLQDIISPKDGTSSILIDTNEEIKKMNPNGNFNIYNTTNAAGLGLSGSGIDGIDHNTNKESGGYCGILEENLCQWHYFYDIVDGTLFNKDFTNSDKLDLNLRYLQERIPDCRCIALNRASNDVLLPDSVKAYLINQFNANQCNKNIDYGQPDDKISNANAEIENYTKSLVKPVFTPLYNKKSTSNNNNYIGYRRQFDPTSITSSGLTLSASGKASSDSSFLYAPDSVRLKNTVNNTYTCTIETNITVNGVGGNSLINGVNSVCNFNNSTPPKSETSGTSTSGTQPTTPVAQSTIVIESITNSFNTPLENDSDTLNISDIIKVNVRYPPNSAYESNFVGNYEFVAISTVDNKQIIFPQNNITCNISSNTTASECKSPYTLRIPFVYGSETNMNGIPYKLQLRSKSDGSNRITATNSKIINLKQYSMRITYVQPIKRDINCYILLGINLNTDDINLSQKLNDVSITLTLTSTKDSTKKITLIKKLNNLLNNYIQFGDGDVKIISDEYNYTVKINEYDMFYDTQMSIDQKNKIDFIHLESKFINSNLEYIDIDDKNSNILVTNNDTIPFCATLIFSWEFLSNSTDNEDDTIDIYYDTKTTYKKDSDSRIKLISDYPLNSLSLQKSGLLINSFKFTCPIIKKSSPIIIYGEVIGKSKTLYTTPVNINTTIGITNYKNWTILDGAWISSDYNQNKIILNNDQDQLIDNYLYSTNVQSPYIIYDSMNKKEVGWYSGTIQPTKNTDPSNIPTYTILVRPDFTKEINIKKISYNNNIINNTNTPSSSSELLSIPYGSNIQIDYSIIDIKQQTPILDQRFDFDINIQVIIGNRNNKLINEIIYSTQIKKEKLLNPDIISFPFFYDITIQNPELYITSYNTFTSKIYPLKIILDQNLELKLTANEIKSSINNQIINISSNPNTTSDDTLIKNIDFTFNNSFNTYYIMLSNFTTNKPLNIVSANLNFKTVDFTKLPLKITFTLPPSSTSTFINVNKGNKNIESYNNIIEYFDQNALSIYINNLQLDLSSSTTKLNTITTIKHIFSGYKTIYIKNLTLICGDKSLDNIKFNIIFSSDSNQNTNYDISTITFIGLLNNKFSILNKISGLEKVMYSVPTKINNNYARIVELQYSNGYYGLPETYKSELNNIVKATVPNKTVTPLLSAPPKESGLSLMTIIFIILGVIIVIGCGTFIYFKYIKKNN